MNTNVMMFLLLSAWLNAVICNLILLKQQTLEVSQVQILKLMFNPNPNNSNLYGSEKVQVVQ